MAAADRKAGLLSPYRVLDLSNELGFLCGKILGDLGADVIKIEPPGGDPARRLGPFYARSAGRKRASSGSASTTTSAASRSIWNPSGRELFSQLLQSGFRNRNFTPGYLDNLDLGYNVIQINTASCSLNHALWSTGPYSRFKASDIESWH
jgi:crotonobetainyl-CoA:carnitine CoA-transferase CaiB-like acyl-CoA transferase